jgi:glycosyltransferase involved in cell wall biosynthesis
MKFWGGGEKLHLEYALEFAKKGYRVHLVCRNNSPLAGKAATHPLQLFFMTAGNLAFLNIFKILRLSSFYKKNHIDTVVFSASQDMKVGAIAAKWAKVSNIVYLRGLAVPIKNSVLNRYLLKRVLTHIVANSEETKRTILQKIKEHIDPAKVKVIYHGIDIHEMDGKKIIIPEYIKTHGKGVILGNAGRLTLQKGQHHLIDIAGKLKEQGSEFTLFIAGTGEMEASLREMIGKKGLQKEVILTGFVEDMDSFMASLDIFVFSSIWEGFGYALAEAMARSKPIVAFDISSNPEILANGRTAFLVPYPNLDLFAEKTLQLIKDKALRQQLGEAGRNEVTTRFQLAERVTEFENYLQSGIS